MNTEFAHDRFYAVEGVLLDAVVEAINLLARHDTQKINANESRDLMNKLCVLMSGSFEPIPLRFSGGSPVTR